MRGLCLLEKKYSEDIFFYKSNWGFSVFHESYMVLLDLTRVDYCLLQYSGIFHELYMVTIKVFSVDYYLMKSSEYLNIRLVSISISVFRR